MYLCILSELYLNNVSFDQRWFNFLICVLHYRFHNMWNLFSLKSSFLCKDYVLANIFCVLFVFLLGARVYFSLFDIHLSLFFSLLLFYRLFSSREVYFIRLDFVFVFVFIFSKDWRRLGGGPRQNIRCFSFYTCPLADTALGFLAYLIP